MTAETVQGACLALPGSAKEYPFGDGVAVYKVGGKMFALLTEGDPPQELSIKLPPDEGQALRATYPEHVRPGYHLNKTHWNTLVLDGALPAEEVLELLRQSYDLIVAALPKRLRPA